MPAPTKTGWSSLAVRRQAYAAMQKTHAAAWGVDEPRDLPEDVAFLRRNAALDRLHGMTEIVAIIEGVEKDAVMAKVRGL
jgi:hypothetical protein